MGNVQIYSTGLVGLSFSIAELTLVGAWAEAQGLQMRVRLEIFAASKRPSRSAAPRWARRPPPPQVLFST